MTNKGVLKVMGEIGGSDIWSGRGSDVLIEGEVVKYAGTLKEVNNMARNVLYVPEEGETGWAEYRVKVVDRGADQSCETCYVNEMEGAVVIYIMDQ